MFAKKRKPPRGVDEVHVVLNEWNEDHRVQEKMARIICDTRSHVDDTVHISDVYRLFPARIFVLRVAPNQFFAPATVDHLYHLVYETFEIDFHVSVFIEQRKD